MQMESLGEASVKPLGSSGDVQNWGKGSVQAAHLKGITLGEAIPFGSGMQEEGPSCKVSLASSPTSGKIYTSVL